MGELQVSKPITQRSTTTWNLFNCQQEIEMKAPNVIKMNVLRKHRTKYIKPNPLSHADVDDFIKVGDLGAYQSYDGDAEYYCQNLYTREYGEDEFHDMVDELAYFHATVRDIDTCINDEEDEMQETYLCELEYHNHISN